jgi:hypothetical protein
MAFEKSKLGEEEEELEEVEEERVHGAGGQ